MFCSPSCKTPSETIEEEAMESFKQRGYLKDDLVLLHFALLKSQDLAELLF